MTRNGAGCARTNTAVSNATTNAPPAHLLIGSPALFHELPNGAVDVGTVHVAVRIHRHALGERRGAGIRIRAGVGDERFHGAVARAADADAAARADVHAVAGRQRGHAGEGPTVARLGVGHVHRVVLVDIDAART